MASAQIVIDQSGAPAGSPSLSRSDLALSIPVVLTNGDNTSVRVWRWALVASPPGSTAVLTSTVGATTSFTPDIEGSYLIELQVNEGRSGERDRRIAAVLNADGLRFPVSGEGTEFNEDGNTQGYGPDLDEILRAASEGGGGSISITDGTTTVAGAETIELDPAFFAVGGTTPTGEVSMSEAPAYSALIRSAGTAGARGDEECGENEFMGRVGDGPLGFHTIDGTIVVPTLLDIDLTAEATLALANGAFPIGGLPFVVDDATRAGAGSGLVSGAGLRLLAPTSQANTWTVSAQDAPFLYVPVSDVPGYLPGVDTLIIDMHLGAAVFEQGNDAIRMGLWALVNTPLAGSAVRARIADRGNHGGVQTLRTFDGTTVGSTAIDVSAFNSYSVIIPPGGDMILGVGNWSSGWPARFTYFWRFATLLSTDSVLAGDGMRFMMSFINSSDASPTSGVDIAHLRFRKKIG